MSNKLLELSWLAEGEYFEINGLENSFKDLCVKRVTDCSVVIEGSKVEDGNLIQLRGWSVSCGTPVKRINKVKKEVPNSTPIPVNKLNKEKIKKEKKKKGRAKS